MRGGFAAAAVLSLGLVAASARAGERMKSATNDMARSAVGGGSAGSGLLSATNRLDGASSEEIVGSSVASATNRLGPGYIQIFAFPGAITQLTSLDVYLGTTTVGLQWTAPGVDGAQGVLPSGSSYYVSIASYQTPSLFLFYSSATIAFSTSGTSPGEDVSTAPTTGLIANTTFWVSVWTKSPAGDLSYPMTFLSTATTLSLAPTAGALEFTSIQRTSATVAWAALAAAPPQVSSMSSSGYVLEASSNNFGALAPPGAPVFSSTTYNVLASTLTVGDSGVGLDLGSTYYFRVASLNPQGKPHYLPLTKLNFQIQQSTGLVTLGAINPSVTRSSVSMSSMVIVNVGNWPVTLELLADTATVNSPWTLSTAPGNEIATLQGVIKSGVVEPLPSAFTTFLTPTFRACTAGGNYSGGGQDCTVIPAGSARTFWFRFTMPDSSVSLGPETLKVQATPTYP